MQTLLSQPVVTILKERTKATVTRLLAKDIEPHLAVILVGEDPSSLKYITIKSRVAKEVGIIVSLYHLEEESSPEQIAETLTFLSKDPEVHGIIVQLPLPEHIPADKIDWLLNQIDPLKDVDGLRGDWKQQEYAGHGLVDLARPQPYSLPPMVASVLSLLDHYQIELANKKVVLVGKGRLVGQPLEDFFKKQKITVQSVDEETEDILHITVSADVLVAGTGQPDLVTYQWVKEGAVVIDCDRDVHSDSVSQIAAALAPSTGGVGPLTVAWLLHNTAEAAAQGESHV